MKQLIKNFTRRLGVLRSLLVLLAVMLILAMPFADVTLSPEGWGVIRSAALPAAAPIVFMVLMLDVMMSQIFKADADEQRRADLSFITRVYLVVSAALVIVWVPVFLKASFF
jgi:hypothetical protein